MSDKNDFCQLYEAVANSDKRIEIVLPIVGQGKSKRFRIEARAKTRVVDFEDVKRSEKIENAAARMHKRLKRAQILG